MSVINSLQQSWLSLDSDTLNLWIAAASYYNVSQRRGSRSLNAHQLFLKYNGIRLWSNLPILTTPALNTIAPLDFTLTITSDSEESGSLLFDKEVHTATRTCLIKLTRPIRLTQFKWERYLRVVYMEWTAWTGYYQDINLKDHYRNIFFTEVQPGDIIGCSVIQFSLEGPFILPRQDYLLTAEEG